MRKRGERSGSCSRDICFITFFSSISPPRSNLFGSSAEPNPLLCDALELHGLQYFVLGSGSSLHRVLRKADRDHPRQPQGMLVHHRTRNADNGNRDGCGVPDPRDWIRRGTLIESSMYICRLMEIRSDEPCEGAALNPLWGH